jgi:hypothetical protein
MVRDSRKAVGEEGFGWGADMIEIRNRIRGVIQVRRLARTNAVRMKQGERQ